MGDGTGIEWAESTWNPTTGCDRVSAGCDHCYAMTMARRLKAMGQPDYQHDGDPRTSGPGFGLSVHPHRLDQPLRWRRPRKVFVNSMSDLFHASVPDAFVAQVWAVMALTPRHTYQVLTKRHARMRSLLSSPRFAEHVSRALTDVLDDSTAPLPAEDYDHAYDWVAAREVAAEPLPALPNVWLGVSAENQTWADRRITALVDTPAVVRFVSAEPLLGPISLRWAPWQPLRRTGVTNEYDGARRLDWVIVGGESGTGSRPMHPGWARTLRDECAEAGVPYLFKQHGAWVEVAPGDARPGDRWVLPDTGGTQAWTHGTAGAKPGRWHEHENVLMRHVGKHTAGRVLDGVVHDGYPTAQQVLT